MSTLRHVASSAAEVSAAGGADALAIQWSVDLEKLVAEIAEVIDLFDTPRFFHLGMDEETAQHQRFYEYVVIRQYDLWWRDLYFLVDQVERKGVRAWVWSDYVWHHPEAFFKKMPRSVLQSNWYYGAEFGRKITGSRAYIDLEAHGYDQVPAGSNWSAATNFPDTVSFCRRHVDPARLKGFMQTVWKPTLKVCRDRHVQAIDLVARARADWKPRRQAARRGRTG